MLLRDGAKLGEAGAKVTKMSGAVWIKVKKKKKKKVPKRSQRVRVDDEPEQAKKRAHPLKFLRRKVTALRTFNLVVLSEGVLGLQHAGIDEVRGLVFAADHEDLCRLAST